MFKIVTDSTADLPVEYLKEHDLGCMNLSYIMDGVTYGQGQELPEKEFYALMRQGKMPTTSQVNPEEAKAHFTEYLKENKEILCIAFSSGLSGTYNSIRGTARLQDHRDRQSVRFSGRGTAGPQGSDFERSGQIHGRSGRVGEE